MRILAAALLIFSLTACDEDVNRRAPLDVRGDTGYIQWNTKGSGKDTGDLSLGGGKGKVRIDWDYVPVTVGILTLVTLYRRFA